MTTKPLKLRLVAMLGAGSIFFFSGIMFLASGNVTADFYDVVVLNGRVMDPESNLDSVRNLGIRGGKIQTITSKSLKGHTVIDAKGLVYVADRENSRVQIFSPDGKFVKEWTDLGKPYSLFITPVRGDPLQLPGRMCGRRKYSGR